jgi:imidazolonepropionase
MVETLFLGAEQIFTGASPDEAGVRTGAALLIRDGHVARLGERAEVRAEYAGGNVVDCTRCVITPGFVDSHTHAVFGGTRAREYVLRVRGATYMEIARQGGGIHASVRDVRQRSQQELEGLARPRLRQMLELGTTTAEVKSGYGLDLEAELKLLRVVRTLAQEGPLDLVPTLLGAHEVPLEYRGRADTWVDVLVEDVIPAVAAEKLARFCDVFMEPGVFTAAQTRRVLEAGMRFGLMPKLHADEFENSGGAQLAAALGAASADHLGAISDAGIAALAASSTVATLLPATLFFLGKRSYAPARKLRSAGAAVALATDYNPGTAPSPSMPLVLTLACSQMGMDPYEALHAATAGGARALHITDGRGTLRTGAPADLIVWDVPDVVEIPYQFGRPPIRSVWKRGVSVA